MPMVQHTTQPGTLGLIFFLCVLFYTTSGSAFSVVRRFKGKRSQDGPGHGQQPWAAQCEKNDGCSREALRAEHRKMNHPKMTPDQDPDELLYIIDSYWEHLNTSTPRRRVPRIGSMRAFYCKPCRQTMKIFEEPISKGGTSSCRYSTNDGDHLCRQPFLSERHLSSYRRARRRYEGYGSKPQRRPVPQCSMFGHYRTIVRTTAENSFKADNTSNNRADDSARAVGSKRRIEVAEEVFGGHVTKPPPIVTLTAAFKTNKAMTIPM